MKYRKKPVVIEAYLYDGDGLKALDWAANVTRNESTHLKIILGDGLYVHTLEGQIAVPIGNYIICGVEGELYSCEPNIFKKTYERVEE